METGVGDGVARGEIVGAVERDVVAAHDLAGVVRPDAPGDGLDLHVGVEARNRVRRAFDLRPVDVGRPVQDLPVQIGERDLVVVDDGERPDAGAGEILQRRRAEPARADDENPRRLQLLLPRSADAAQDDLAGVAFDLLVAEFHRRLRSPLGTGVELRGRGPLTLALSPPCGEREMANGCAHSRRLTPPPGRAGAATRAPR